MSGAALGLALRVLLAPLAAPPVVVDQVVAVVDNEVITESELLIETRVALVARQGGEGLALADGPLDPELVAATREYLVNQVLIAGHARRLGSIDVSAEEVERALRAFARRFPSTAAYQAFLRKYDVSEDTLREILRRDIQNERTIQGRMRSWLVGDQSDSAQRARAEVALARWLEDLRRAADIRLLGPSGELERP